MTDYTIVMKKVNTIEEAFVRMAAGHELYRANFLVFDTRNGKSGNFVKIEEKLNGALKMENICNYPINEIRNMFKNDSYIFYFKREEVNNETENEE